MQRNLFSALVLASCLSGVVHAASNKPVPQLPKEWEEIVVGGEALCSRGTPYSFFVSQGKSNKVVIDFMGGGACWDEETCAHDTKTFLESVADFKRIFEPTGIYARKHNDNPLKDWTHVIVPYCTGDLHWGSNDQEYTREDGRKFTINHRGAFNTRAVLKYVEEHFRNPEKVLVTGYSAGAYASVYWLPPIQEMYKHSSVMQFGDSGISPITEGFAKKAFTRWNAQAAFTQWNVQKTGAKIPDLDPKNVDWNKLQIGFIYEKLMNYLPDIPFGHYTTAFDGTQRGFFWLMHGDTKQWPELVKNTLQTLGKSSKFRYFSSQGTEHGILAFTRFYDVKSTDDELFQKWFKSYVEGGTLKNHDCVNCIDDEKEMWIELRKPKEPAQIEEANLEL